MKYNKIIILLVLTIFLICCKNYTKKQEKLFKSNNEINIKAFADLLTTDYLSVSDSLIFHKNISEISFFGKKSDTLVSKILDYKFINNKKEDLLWVIIITKPLNFDCHPCSPAFGSVLLNKNRLRWSLLNLDYFTKSGNFGEPSPHNWYKLNRDIPTLLIKRGFTSQGLTEENFEFYTILNDSITKILDIKKASQEYYSDKESWSFFSSINFESSKNKFKNLTVRKSGTIYNEGNGSIIKVDSIYKYEFHSNKYELMSIK